MSNGVRDRLLRHRVLRRWHRRSQVTAEAELGPRRSVRLGLAIGSDRVVAVELKRYATGWRPVATHGRALTTAPEHGDWPELRQALIDLLEELSVASGTASVALLRPLAQAKTIQVPPVRRSHLRALVARNLRRYFIVSDGPVVSDAVGIGSPAGDAVRSAIAVCGKLSLIEAIAKAVQEAGLRLENLTAASLALSAAINNLVPDVRRASSLVAVLAPGWMEGIVLRHGVPRLFESWDHAGSNAVTASAQRLTGVGLYGGSDAGQAETRALVLAETAEQGAEVERQIRGLGIELTQCERSGRAVLKPYVLAALGSALPAATAPSLLPARTRRDLGRRESRRLTMAAAAAAALVFASAGLHLWDVGRELEHVSGARQAHAAALSQALEMRQTNEAVRQRLLAIGGYESMLVRWTPILTSLANALPDSAYLVSFSVDGVQVRLNGMAPSASAVVPALQTVPLFAEVELVAVAKRQTGGSIESFDITLTLGSRDGSSSVTAAMAGGTR